MTSEPENFDNSFDPDDLVPRPDASVINFTPSLNNPMPSFRCTKIKKDGERCKNHALAGMLPENAKCPAHGGNAPGVVEAAENRKDAVRLALLNNTELAVQTLESLMDPSVSDAVRLKAATEVLDRTVGKAPLELNVTETVTVDAAEQLLVQLAKLAEGDKHDEIIEDAEVVDEYPREQM